jgi:flagellar hook-associated protein 1 FlgK
VSTFSGLSTALTSLYAQRRGLDVTGQNIANANTDGYSRQRVNFESVGAPAVPALWSTYRGAGSGVAATDIERLRDVFLESRARTEQQKLAHLTGRQDTLAGIERSFREPGDTGLQSQLSELWSSWHDVANQPGDLAARAQLLERTATVGDSIRQAHASLDAMWGAGREQMETTVAAVNAAAANVAELNQAILRSNQAGIPSNELADKRDLLVMQLADLVGATGRAGADGTIDVYLGGTALVRGSQVEELTVTGATNMEGYRTTGVPASIVWAASGAVAQSGGRAGAQVEALSTTIPGYADQLDDVVTNLVSELNVAHRAGYDLDGNAGTDLFAAGATAKDITGLITDPRKVAASSEAPTYGPDGTTVVSASLDGSNAAKIAEIERQAAGPDRAYRQLIVKLGTDAQTANRRLEIQADVAVQINAAREAQSGVNFDEEMVNLLSFQRAYEAAARVISTVDATLDVLINRTGLVGR